MIKGKEQDLQNLNVSLKIHEQALSDLQATLEKVELSYNARGYELTMARRKEMGMDDSTKTEMVIGSTGDPVPMISLVVLPQDRALDRLAEERAFLNGEIIRVSKKLTWLRGMLAQFDTQ